MTVKPLTIDAAAARIAELEAALRPFALAGQLIATAAPDNMILHMAHVAGNYRRAALALGTGE